MSSSRSGAAGNPGGRIAITGVRLIDGRGGDPIEDAVVLVEGSVIAAAGAGAEVPFDRDAQVLEAPGATLMPGLIDGTATSAGRPSRTRTGGFWRTTGTRRSRRQPRPGSCWSTASPACGTSP